LRGDEKAMTVNWLMIEISEVDPIGWTGIGVT
jgi:hypothetical protein